MMLHYALLNVIFKKFYLVLAVLGPCCCTGFSLVSVSRGYSPAVVLRLLTVMTSLVVESGLQASEGFSSCSAWAQQLRLVGSGSQAQQLWRRGLVALWHVGSSQSRDRNHVPCIGRQILNHLITREALELL